MVGRRSEGSEQVRGRLRCWREEYDEEAMPRGRRLPRHSACCVIIARIVCRAAGEGSGLASKECGALEGGRGWAGRRPSEAAHSQQGPLHQRPMQRPRSQSCYRRTGRCILAACTQSGHSRGRLGSLQWWWGGGRGLTVGPNRASSSSSSSVARGWQAPAPHPRISRRCRTSPSPG